MKKTKAYLCHWCKRIYIGKRPLLCECKSNAFLREHETTEEEINQLKKENTNIKIIYNNNLGGQHEKYRQKKYKPYYKKNKARG